MTKLFANINAHFARRPQSRIYLTRLVLYLVAAVSAGTLTSLDWTEVTLLLLGIGGFDLAGMKYGETKTTPVDDPKLGKNDVIPPALYEQALKVLEFLPEPIDVIFKTLGVPGLELAVKTAQEAMRRSLTYEEAGKALREGQAAQ